MAPGKGDTDLMLHGLAARLITSGLRPCGTVQINSERCDGGPCDMDVKVLPDGPVMRISQNLGPSARGCRLDPDALERSVFLAEQALEAGADVLIVNKFGKHEAQGRGFRPLIAEAVSRGVPVIIGVNALNLPEFKIFTGGLATKVASCQDDLMHWLASSLAQAA